MQTTLLWRLARAAPYFLFTVRGSFAHRFTAARCGDQFPFSLFFLFPAYTFRLIEAKGDCARGEIKREERRTNRTSKRTQPTALAFLFLLTLSNWMDSERWLLADAAFYCRLT
jgi:hypothetical protein